MPMFLWLDAAGGIRAAGPTLAKLLPAGCIAAAPSPAGSFFDLFELRRPRGIADMAALLHQAGTRLHLRLRQGPGTGFRGLAMPLAEDQGALVNLSFGISVAEAVRAHGLTDADFAPTDLTVEMLYLAEAKSVVMGELHDLNRRLQQAKLTAEEQALTDTLTGLANRRGFDQVLEGLLRAEVDFGLMHLDLDRFKQVNDNFGHAAGDHVLRVVARRLGSEVRAGDTIARIGGDEFVVLFPGPIHIDRLTGIARRIITRLSQPIDCLGTPCRVGASVGLTVSPFYDRPEPLRMMDDADRALYASKHGGRGRVTVWSEALVAGPAPVREGDGTGA
ncbi:diguanylate cyclase domain-containing protein [Acidimangrovimonas pyrenivorans]|uniref:Diguanylate cyclase domain-containing protein n=1 Tax=Acidimangrovimonas pyrenivorans TaxID=2030798 RepID=A0ABV7AH77_9RHOB